MNGKVESLKKDTWNEITYYHVKLEGNPKDYSCWNKECANVKVGDNITFREEEKNNRWKLILDRPGGTGGGRAKTPEEINNQLKSFSISYSKDIAVAEINKGIARSEGDMMGLLFQRANAIYEWLKITT
jgi:hypothetical protein